MLRIHKYLALLCVATATWLAGFVHHSPTSAASKSTFDEKELPFIYGQMIK
jgi:hypothetical protein